MIHKISDNVYQVEISKYKAVVVKAKSEKDAIRKAKRKRF